MSDKRKIERLEEDLRNEETARKKVEREKTRLERDLRELQEECETLRRQAAPAPSSPQPRELFELQKKITTLQSETDRLREEVNKYKDEAASARRQMREARQYEPADGDSSRRQLERQIDELKTAHEKALRESQDEIKRLQSQLAGTPPKSSTAPDIGRSGRGVSFRGRSSLSGASAAPANNADLSALRTKVEGLEKELEKKEKQQQRELRALQDKVSDEQAAKDRLEKQLKRVQDELKEATAKADAESKAKWGADHEKMRLQGELRDALRLVDTGKEEIAKQRLAIGELEQKLREKSGSTRDEKAKDSKLVQLEKEFAAYKKEQQDERERERTRDQRRIASLESELNEYRTRVGKTETTENTLTAESRRLTSELRQLRTEYDNYKADAERDKRRAESALESARRTMQSDIDDLQAHVKKLKEKQKAESEKKVESAAAASRPMAPSSSIKELEKERLQLEALERDKLVERARLLEAERVRLSDALVASERDLNAKIAELKAKLKEKEQQFAEKKEQLTEQDKLREKEAAAERKRLQELEQKRSQEFEEVSHKLIDEQAARRALEDKLRKALDDYKSLQGLLEDEKEEHKLDNERSAARQKHVQSELEALQSEQHEWLAEARKLEQQLREAEDEAIKHRRAWEDTKVELDSTKFTLEKTRQDAEKTEVELQQKVAALDLKVATLEKQLHLETTEKVAQTKRAATLEQRVDQLEFYFLRPEEQLNKQDFSTPAVQLMKKMKSEQSAELDAIRKAHARGAASDTASLTERFRNSLQNLPQAHKEVMAYQIKKLMETLEEGDFAKDIQMGIVTTLVEGLVDAEIIRELRLVATLYLEREVSPLETPEAIIKVAERRVAEQKLQPDYLSKKRSEILSFRDALLNLLAEMRHARTKQPVDDCREGIVTEVFSTAE